MSSIYGIDISNNNGNVDLSSVAKAGVKYIYMKATEGSSFKDKYLDGFYNQCKKYNLKAGAYHFLVGTSSPESQAENFYNKIKNYSWDLIPMLDVETNFTNLDNYVIRFIVKFRQLSNLDLGLYSYSSFIPYLTNIQNSIKDMKFWEANYNGKPWNLKSNFFTGRVGHQYTDKGSFGTFTGDCNVFTENALLTANKKGEWICKDNKWWYKHSDGSYTSNGWEKIDNKWYLFDKDGWMLYSWQYSSGGNWYYLGHENDGAMKIGWLLQDNHWYYLNKDGAMVKGWNKIDNEWYYFDSNGVMLTGWIKDNNKDYLLYSNGKMAHDTIAYGYKFDSKGVATKL